MKDLKYILLFQIIIIVFFYTSFVYAEEIQVFSPEQTNQIISEIKKSCPAMSSEEIYNDVDNYLSLVTFSGPSSTIITIPKEICDGHYLTSYNKGDLYFDKKNISEINMEVTNNQINIENYGEMNNVIGTQNNLNLPINFEISLWPWILIPIILLIGFFIFLFYKDKDLKSFSVNFKNGKVEAVFAKKKEVKEKIKNEIKENNESFSNKKMETYELLENKILEDMHQQLGGELKKKIKYVYGSIDNPDFTYIPDGTIKTEKELIFIDIKNLIHPDIEILIIKKSIRQLEHILEKFKPYSPDINLKAKLVIASKFNIDISKYKTSSDIDLEFVKYNEDLKLLN